MDYEYGEENTDIMASFGDIAMGDILSSLVETTGRGDDLPPAAEIFNHSAFNRSAFEGLIAELFNRSVPEFNMSSAPRDCDYVKPAHIRCDERQLYRNLMGYGFLPLFCLAIIGNCLNLFIYSSDQIRFFVAIRMLCTKLLMNTCMMICMLPQALRVINLWEPGGPTDQIYWKIWPYQAYFINVFGFCALWLTVLMIAECYIHIFFPTKSKSVCTKQMVWRSYVIIAIIGLTIALIYPLNRSVTVQEKCGSVNIAIQVSQSYWMTKIEMAHTLASFLLSILVPLVLLVFMTVMISWKLVISPSCLRRRRQNAGGQNGTGMKAEDRPLMENHFSAEKRGVTRIAMITTLVQLITEFPSMPVFIYAAVHGPHIVNSSGTMCAWQTVSHFLGLWNASLSFFLYLAFSTRFRKTMRNRIQTVMHKYVPDMLTNSQMQSVKLQNFPTSQYVLSSRTTSPRSASRQAENGALLVVPLPTGRVTPSPSSAHESPAPSAAINGHIINQIPSTGKRYSTLVVSGESSATSSTELVHENKNSLNRPSAERNNSICTLNSLSNQDTFI